MRITATAMTPSPAIIMMIMVVMVVSAVQWCVKEIILLHVGLDNLEQFMSLEGSGTPPGSPSPLAATSRVVAPFNLFLQFSALTPIVFFLLCLLLLLLLLVSFLLAAPSILGCHSQLDADGPRSTGREGERGTHSIVNGPHQPSNVLWREVTT